MKDRIFIRKASAGDLASLAEISRDTFISAFAGSNSKADMDLYINSALSNEQLEQELHSHGTEFFLVENAGEVIGYFKLNEDKTGHISSLEIERIYVVHSMQNSGIGSFLLSYIEVLAVKRSIERLWLGVWEKNNGAIKLYERKGFRVFGSHAFTLGKDVQNDLLMEKLIFKTDAHLSF